MVKMAVLITLNKRISQRGKMTGLLKIYQGRSRNKGKKEDVCHDEKGNEGSMEITNMKLILSQTTFLVAQV